MHTKVTYKKSRAKPAVVYWIHYLEHTNPYTDGYIGITTNLDKRVKCHKRTSPHVGNRLNSGAVVTVLHEVSNLNEAAFIEATYRPDAHIGWNINPGGDIPPSRRGLPGHSRRGDDRTDKQKQAAADHSIFMKGNIPWNKGKKGMQVAWNKGILNPAQSEKLKEITECPHCGKSGSGLAIRRWHFNNCKFKVGA